MLLLIFMNVYALYFDISSFYLMSTCYLFLAWCLEPYWVLTYPISWRYEHRCEVGTNWCRLVFDFYDCTRVSVRLGSEAQLVLEPFVIFGNVWTLETDMSMNVHSKFRNCCFIYVWNYNLFSWKWEWVSPDESWADGPLNPRVRFRKKWGHHKSYNNKIHKIIPFRSFIRLY